MNSQKGFAPLIIIIIVVAILGLGGGGYYEFVYHPQQYAKSLLKVFDEMQKNQQQAAGQLSPQERDAYNLTPQAFELQKKLFSELQGKIANFRPPYFGEMRQLHKDLLWMLDKTLALADEREKQVKILGEGVECQDALEPKNAPNQNTAMIREFQQFFAKFIENIKTTCGRFVEEGGMIPTTGTPSFAELKTAWPELPPALDIIINLYRRLDPNTPARDISQSGPKPSEKEAFSKLKNFTRALNTFLSNNSLNQIPGANYLNPSNLPGDEARQVNDRVNKVMNKIKEQYGK